MRSPWISLEMDGCVASAAPQTLLHSTLLKHSLRAVAATALHGCPTRDEQSFAAAAEWWRHVPYSRTVVQYKTTAQGVTLTLESPQHTKICHRTPLCNGEGCPCDARCSSWLDAQRGPRAAGPCV